MEVLLSVSVACVREMASVHQLASVVCVQEMVWVHARALGACVLDVAFLLHLMAVFLLVLVVCVLGMA